MSINSHTNNGLSPASLASLDLALEGHPAKVKARVQQLVIKRGIDPADPIWEIVIALDILRVLIEDGPKEWRSLFEQFTGELEVWSASNRQTLAALERELTAFEGFAEHTEALEVRLREVSALCAELKELLARVEDTNDGFSQQVGELRAIAIRQNQQLRTLTKNVKELQQRLDRPAFLRRGNWISSVAVLLVGAIVLVTCMAYWVDRPKIIKTDQTTNCC